MDHAFEAATLFSLCYGVYIAVGLFSQKGSAALFFLMRHFFSLYLGTLILMTLLPAGRGGRGVNFRLFLDMFVTVSGRVRLRPGYLSQSLLNALLFAPFGFTTAALSGGGKLRRVVFAVLLSAAASALIEFLQWLLPLGRILDVDDLFYNAVGGLCGALAFLLFRNAAARFLGPKEVL